MSDVSEHDLSAYEAMVLMYHGYEVEDDEYFYRYTFTEDKDEIYKYRKSEGILLSNLEFMHLDCHFKAIEGLPVPNTAS